MHNLKMDFQKNSDLSLTVAIVIPLFFSSGALSISSKATALALPSSASTFKFHKSTKNVHPLKKIKGGIPLHCLSMKTKKSTQTLVIAAVSVVFP